MKNNVLLHKEGVVSDLNNLLPSILSCSAEILDSLVNTQLKIFVYENTLTMNAVLEKEKIISTSSFKQTFKGRR